MTHKKQPINGSYFKCVLLSGIKPSNPKDIRISQIDF